MYLAHYQYKNSVSWSNSKTYIWYTLQECKQRVTDYLFVTISSLDKDDIYSVKNLIIQKESWYTEHCEIENWYMNIWVHWYMDISIDWFMFVYDDEVHSAVYKKIEPQMTTEL